MPLAERSAVISSEVRAGASQAGVGGELGVARVPSTELDPVAQVSATAAATAIRRYEEAGGLRVGKSLSRGNEFPTALLLELLDSLRGVLKKAALRLDPQFPGSHLVGHCLAHVR